MFQKVTTLTIFGLDTTGGGVIGVGDIVFRFDEVVTDIGDGGGASASSSSSSNSTFSGSPTGRSRGIVMFKLEQGESRSCGAKSLAVRNKSSSSPEEIEDMVTSNISCLGFDSKNSSGSSSRSFHIDSTLLRSSGVFGMSFSCSLKGLLEP